MLGLNYKKLIPGIIHVIFSDAKGRKSAACGAGAPYQGPQTSSGPSVYRRVHFASSPRVWV